MTQIRYYTPEGLQKLKDEVTHLIMVERPAISQAIAEARDKGDLSENAEYDAAKTGVRDIMTAIRKGADATYNSK